MSFGVGSAVIVGVTGALAAPLAIVAGIGAVAGTFVCSAIKAGYKGFKNGLG